MLAALLLVLVILVWVVRPTGPRGSAILVLVVLAFPVLRLLLFSPPLSASVEPSRPRWSSLSQTLLEPGRTAVSLPPWRPRPR